MMTVGELREALEDLEDDVEVRIATQPSWPLAFHIGNVWVPSQYEDVEAERRQERYEDLREEGMSIEDADALLDEEFEDEDDDDQAKFVWIATGDGNCSDYPYAPRYAWD